MKLRKIITKGLALAALLGCVVPEQMWAAAAADAKQAAADVALRDGGVLLGQIVDCEGRGVAGAPVALRSKDREIAATKTGQGGYFAAGGLRGGVYQIVTTQGHGTYRLWAPGTAPPSAQQGALVVSGPEALRGNLAGALKFHLSDPCVLAALAIGAAAVAIPVVLHNTDGGRPASP